MGQAADWTDYSGVVAGKTVGVTLMNPPIESAFGILHTELRHIFNQLYLARPIPTVP